MCTLSWQKDGSCLDVFFNRDEQKSRSEAHAPQFWHDYQAVFPVDPQGGGTWLAVSVKGYVYALLNNYQSTSVLLRSATEQGLELKNGRGLQKVRLSRGMVITMLLQKSEENFQNNCKLLPLRSFLPFTLVRLHPEEVAQCCHWDGESVHVEVAKPPLISSGVELEQVRTARYQCYKQQHQSFADLWDFHHSHQPGPSALSVCMHRDDAHTVSFSHIRVTDQIKFHYQAGSPCQPQGPSVLVLVPRKSCNAPPKNNFSCL